LNVKSNKNLFKDHGKYDQIFRRLTIRRSNIPQPYYIHIPSVTFIEYISSIGGLISLWFGFSFWTSIDKFIESLVIKTEFISKIIKNIFKKLLLSITLFLFIYQTIELLMAYQTNSIITKIEIHNKKQLPQLSICVPIVYDKNSEKFAFKLKSNEVFDHFYYYRNSFSSSFLQNLFQILPQDKDSIVCKIVSDMSFESCDYISRPLISQRFKIYEKKTSDLNISIHSLRCFTYFSQPYLNQTYLMLENSKIDIIIRFMARASLSSALIIFNAFKDEIEIKANRYVSSPLTIYDCTVWLHKTIQKLVPTIYQNCKSYSYGRNNCVKDCILSKINNQLSCIPINISFNFNEFDSKYRLCNKFGNYYSLDQNFKQSCEQFCEINCIQEYVSFSEKCRKTPQIEEYSTVDIVVKNEPQIIYINEYAMKFEDLIYYLGGLAGLYFGISVIHLLAFLQKLTQILIYSKIKKIITTENNETLFNKREKYENK
jgi:hypothetical protein